MREILDAPAVAVPGYVVGARLGAGGFGEVFEARHGVIDRTVAIKVLHAKYSTDPDAVARFVAEARAVNRVKHPGIVEIYDFGQLADGRHYCVMELVKGRTLRDVLRECSRLPVAEALAILRGIAEAVDAAHAASIAHRDLKPDNVFVLDDGAIKLIDFGLAKLTLDETPVTQTGAVFGTPLYMSPEQCRGRAVDTRTDAYSFGTLAYHILTGEPPFSGDALELALHHLHDEARPPSQLRPELDARIDRTILALLAKDPAERPTPLARAVDAMHGRAKLRRRVPWRWIALGAGAVGLAVGGVVVTAGRGESPVRECPLGTERLATVWDGATRAAIGARYDALAGQPNVSGSWRSVSRAFDAYAARWAAQWDDACTRDRERDPLLHVQRKTCLDNALVGLAGAVESLRQTDVRTFSEGYTGWLVLPSLPDCASTQVLRTQAAAPPPEHRDEIARLLVEIHVARGDLRAAINAQRMEHVERGFERLERIAKRLAELESPLAARPLLWAGHYRHQLMYRTWPRDPGPARAAIARTVAEATRRRDDEGLADILGTSVELETALGTDASQIEPEIRAAEAALARGGQPQNASWSFHSRQARFEEREGRLARALELVQSASRRNATAPIDYGIWTADHQQPQLLAKLGRHAEAVDVARELLAFAIEGFTDRHIVTANARAELATMLAVAGRRDEALAEQLQAVALYETLGVARQIAIDGHRRLLLLAIANGSEDEARRVLAKLAALGESQREMLRLDWTTTPTRRFIIRTLAIPPGELDPTALDDAEAWFAYREGDRAALARHAARTTTAAPTGWSGRWLLGFNRGPWLRAIVDAQAGRTASAKRQLAALRASRKSDGDARFLAALHELDALVALELGDATAARGSFIAAGETPPDTVEPLVARGQVALLANDLEVAIRMFEKANRVLVTAFAGNHEAAPLAHFGLARALWQVGRDQPRARALAEHARAELAKQPHRATELATVEQWLEAR